MQNLKGNPLPWLLDPDNPSVRYWPLVDILRRPANDPDVQAVSAAIDQQPLVKEYSLFSILKGIWVMIKPNFTPRWGL